MFDPEKNATGNPEKTVELIDDGGDVTDRRFEADELLNSRVSTTRRNLSGATNSLHDYGDVTDRRFEDDYQ